MSDDEFRSAPSDVDTEASEALKTQAVEIAARVALTMSLSGRDISQRQVDAIIQRLVAEHTSRS